MVLDDTKLPVRKNFGQHAELLGMDQHSVHAAATIKNKIDTVDPFYTYKINDRK